jgi:LPS sulfotransferase NodH
VIRDPARVRMGLAKRRALLSARVAGHRVASWTTAHDVPPRRPIFIIGCPRSGTTLLFELLKQHEDLGSLAGEGHVLWHPFQHPRKKQWSSDAAGAEDVQPGERRYIYSAVGRIAPRGRFLDKTPKNCLKVPYLLELFPDAIFVLLKRNGPDTVGSLIEGWRVRQTVSYRLPERLELAEYRGRMWSYVLPPGWRAWKATSIAEVAALQYVTSYDAALDALQRLDCRMVSLAFEELLSDPHAETERILNALELPVSPSVMEVADRLGSHHVQTNSPPRPEKWRDNVAEIARVLPQIAPTMARLGYGVPSDL